MRSRLVLGDPALLQRDFLLPPGVSGSRHHETGRAFRPRRPRTFAGLQCVWGGTGVSGGRLFSPSWWASRSLPPKPRSFRSCSPISSPDSRCSWQCPARSTRWSSSATAGANRPAPPDPSSSHVWLQVESLLAVDDNLLPYSTVPLDSPTTATGSPSYTAKSFDSFIVALPDKIYYPADAVEGFSKRVEGWLAGMRVPAAEPLQLRRYFITTVSRLRDYARDNHTHLGDTLLGLIMHLETAQFVWVVEYCSVAQWSAGLVAARAIIDATASPQDPVPIWLLHDERVAHVFDRTSAKRKIDSILLDRPGLGPLPRIELNLRPVVESPASPTPGARHLTDGRRHMNQGLKDYLQKCTPAQVDESSLDELRQEMEKAVPEIAESIQEREELAAALRIATITAVPLQSAAGTEGLGTRRRAPEPLVGGLDDRLERVGTVIVEVGICAKKPGHHRHRFRLVLRRKRELHRVDSRPCGQRREARGVRLTALWTFSTVSIATPRSPR